MRGSLRKRSEEVASWRHTNFTKRINSNEGTALGPFLYFVSLFTKDDDVLSAGFATTAERDAFKNEVSEAIARANNW